MTDIISHANPPFVFDLVTFSIVVLAAIAASSLSELISYFLLYRKEEYRLNKSKYQTKQVRYRS